MTKKFYIYLTFAFIISVFTTSCSNYKLANTPMDLPFKSVYVKPIRNDSFAPQASATLSTQLSNQLARTSQLRLEGINDAQAILEVKIIDYTKLESASSEEDTGVAQSFTIRMTVECTLYDRTTKKVYLDKKEVSANISTYVNSSGVLAQEYQTMPQLCRELATNIANEVIAIW